MRSLLNKFQGDMLNFCDFIHVYVFTTNHHLKSNHSRVYKQNYDHVYKPTLGLNKPKVGLYVRGHCLRLFKTDCKSK